MRERDIPDNRVFAINVGFVRFNGSARTEVRKNVIDFNRRRVRQGIQHLVRVIQRPTGRVEVIDRAVTAGFA
jgi:hypothetical protein